jgi:glucose/arabinose dehydrogenase
MRSNLLRTTSIILALLGSAAFAAAQQSSPPADGQQQSQQEKAQQTPSGKAGKEEPSSQAPAARPEDNAVLVNGALAVPGAAANTDTVPAKFSEKNAADDKLITVAYTFKTLTDDERQAIYEGLKGEPAGSARNAEVGDVLLPAEVALRAVPDTVAARVPQTKDYQYAVAVDRVLLVSPLTWIVVGVFRAPEPPANVGRQAQ